MTKRIISLFVIAMLLTGLMGLMVGCKDDGPLTPEEAMAIAQEDMGIGQNDQASIDVHVTTVNGEACYAVYLSVGNTHMQYVIHGTSGEILSKVQTDAGHHH